MAAQPKVKYIPHWGQTPGKIKKSGQGMIIHPYDLISLVHKKKGLEQAGKVATQLLSQKYNKIFEEEKS